jgi:hypothetical protein
LIVEHNTDVLASCDHLIELGPKGGDGGGVVVAEGTPESIASSNTATGRFLAKALKPQSPKSAKVTSKVASRVTSEALDKVKRASRKKVLGD